MSVFGMRDAVDAIKDLMESKVKKDLQKALKNASTALEYASYMVGSSENQALLKNYKEKIDSTLKVISKADTAIKNLNIALKIVDAAKDLRGDIRQDPQRSAKAFGRLFSGMGELAHYLPFPIKSYFEIFKDAENFFETLRVQMQPEIHMREPGIREIINNL